MNYDKDSSLTSDLSISLKCPQCGMQAPSKKAFEVHINNFCEGSENSAKLRLLKQEGPNVKLRDLQLCSKEAVASLISAIGDNVPKKDDRTRDQHISGAETIKTVDENTKKVPLSLLRQKILQGEQRSVSDIFDHLSRERPLEKLLKLKEGRRLWHETDYNVTGRLQQSQGSESEREVVLTSLQIVETALQQLLDEDEWMAESEKRSSNASISTNEDRSAHQKVSLLAQIDALDGQDDTMLEQEKKKLLKVEQAAKEKRETAIRSLKLERAMLRTKLLALHGRETELDGSNALHSVEEALNIYKRALQKAKELHQRRASGRLTNVETTKIEGNDGRGSLAPVLEHPSDNAAPPDLKALLPMQSAGSQARDATSDENRLRLRNETASNIELRIGEVDQDTEKMGKPSAPALLEKPKRPRRKKRDEKANGQRQQRHRGRSRRVADPPASYGSFLPPLPYLNAEFDRIRQENEELTEELRRTRESQLKAKHLEKFHELQTAVSSVQERAKDIPPATPARFDADGDERVSDIVADHQRKMALIEMEMERLAVEKEHNKLTADVEKKQFDDERFRWYQSLQKRLRKTESLRLVARGTNFDPVQGFTIFFDFLSGLAPQHKAIKIYYTVLEGKASRGGRMLVCDPVLGEYSTLLKGYRWIFEVCKEYSMFPPAPDVGILVEVEEHRSQVYVPIGWSYIPLFDSKKNFLEGPWELRLFTGRPNVKISYHQKSDPGSREGAIGSEEADDTQVTASVDRNENEKEVLWPSMMGKVCERNVDGNAGNGYVDKHNRFGTLFVRLVQQSEVDTQKSIEVEPSRLLPFYVPAFLEDGRSCACIAAAEGRRRLRELMQRMRIPHVRNFNLLQLFQEYLDNQSPQHLEAISAGGPRLVEALRVKNIEKQHEQTSKPSEQYQWSTARPQISDSVEVFDMESELRAEEEEKNKKRLEELLSIYSDAELEMAAYLGIDPLSEQHLMYIATRCIEVPLPAPWREYLTEDGTPYYHHPDTNQTTYEHPLDEYFKDLVQKKKASSSKGRRNRRKERKIPQYGEEVIEMAEYLVFLISGIDPEDEFYLLHIAAEALTTAVVPPWEEHEDEKGDLFYYNPLTRVSTYEHPLDEHFKSRVLQERMRDSSLGENGAQER